MQDNTGIRSTGIGSTGHWSAGHRSTGDWSTGIGSTGDRSTGIWSTGNWSISHYSTGHFSTIDHSGFGAFNKPCTVEEWKSANKPNYMFFNLTEWISESDMTGKEKKENEKYKDTGGYLKVYKYKEAWAKAWNGASAGEKKATQELPNFDADIFKEITGIDTKNKSKGEITIDGVRYKRVEK